MAYIVTAGRSFGYHHLYVSQYIRSNTCVYTCSLSHLYISIHSLGGTLNAIKRSLKMWYYERCKIHPPDPEEHNQGNTDSDSDSDSD